jgi:hypothetical protein
MIQRYQKGPRMSQAAVHAGTVYIAGKVARNSKGSLQEQTRDVLEQIEALLAEAGSDKSKLLSIGINERSLRCLGRQGQSAGARLRRSPARQSRSQGRDHGYRRCLKTLGGRMSRRCHRPPLDYTNE